MSIVSTLHRRAVLYAGVASIVEWNLNIAQPRQIEPVCNVGAEMEKARRGLSGLPANRAIWVQSAQRQINISIRGAPNVKSLNSTEL